MTARRSWAQKKSHFSVRTATYSKYLRRLTQRLRTGARSVATCNSRDAFPPVTDEHCIADTEKEVVTHVEARAAAGRMAWGDFSAVNILGVLGDTRAQPCYPVAKAGDAVAACEIIREIEARATRPVPAAASRCSIACQACRLTIGGGGGIIRLDMNVKHACPSAACERCYGRRSGGWCRGARPLALRESGGRRTREDRERGWRHGGAQQHGKR